MTERALNPWLKIALELGPVAAFFVVYARTDIFTATAVFIPVILAALGLSWALSRKLPQMAVVTAVVVVVFGGLTLWLQDPTFIKMKPTLVYLIFAGALGYGLLRGRSYLRIVLGDAMPLTEAAWMTFTRRWLGFFIVMAALNEAVWRTQTEAFWVGFKTFAFPVVTFVFVMAQAPFLTRNAPPAPEPEAPPAGPALDAEERPMIEVLPPPDERP